MKVQESLLIVLMILSTATAASAQRSKQPQTTNPFDRKIGELSDLQNERIEQRDSVLQEQAALGREAKPMLDEQEALEQKAVPFLQIKKSILERDKNLSVRDSTHSGNCHSGDLQPEPYKACVNEHNALEQEAKNIKTDWDYNENNLRPIQDRYNVLDGKLKPYIEAYRSLDIKLKAIEREIVRYDKMIKGLESCKAETRCPPAGCSQKQLEFMKLCEDIKWGNADPKLLLVDPTLASLDPNLPPAGWRPPRLKIGNQ